VISSRRDSVRAVTGADGDALHSIAALAAGYSLPHNVLGTTAAPAYALQLAQHPAGRWYGLFDGRRLLAAAHLALYGQGDGQSHSLWKIRHPLARPEASSGPEWTRLFDALVEEALALRPGSLKAVMFLSEHERDAGEAAVAAGFAVEGVLDDFYRLEERCLIYGRTARSWAHFPPST
jgi:hypothetical protein